MVYTKFYNEIIAQFFQKTKIWPASSAILNQCVSLCLGEGILNLFDAIDETPFR